MEKLRAYISIVKERFQPVISDDAALLLERHYEKIRSAGSTVIPVTVRFLESLIRLSQAHARLMYRSEVTLEDAVAVLRVMECSAYAYGGFDGNVDDIENVLYSDPMTMDVLSQKADEEFLVFEYQILKRYDMIDRMTEERRNHALSQLEVGEEEEQGGHAPSTAGGWHEMENPRDSRNTSVVHDHYGRSYFSPPNSQDAKRRRKG
jgi:DNA replicative helicase MCM subunit Mcm2 (Cdc46/Mcm family)